MQDHEEKRNVGELIDESSRSERKSFRRKMTMGLLVVFLSIAGPCGYIIYPLFYPSWDASIRGQLDAATARINKNPQDAVAYYTRGELLTSANKLEEGVVDLRGAIELDKNLFWCRWKLADALVTLNKPREALLHFRYLSNQLVVEERDPMDIQGSQDYFKGRIEFLERQIAQNR